MRLYKVGVGIMFFLCGALLMCGADAFAESSGILVIRPNVMLPSDGSGALRLADISDLGTIPAAMRSEVMRHLEAIELTDRPAVGEERSFTEEGLRDVVGEANRRFEAAGLVVEWRVPSRTTVYVQTDRSKIESAVRSELARFCDHCDVKIQRIDWPMIDWRDVVSWRVKPLTARPRGSFAVGIEFSNREGRSKSAMVSGLMTVSQTVPVLARSVGPGEKIAEQDIQMVVRDVTYATDSGARLEDFGHSVVSRGLAVGDILWKSLFRRELVLKFGDPVRVQVAGESWAISTDGIAQSPAAVGDTVKVKVNRSQKLVSGILKEKGLVEIQ